MHPDEAGPLRRRQLHQAVAGAVHGAEVPLRVNADQCALLVVGPGVVGAGEALGAAGAGGHDLRAPMPAHVDEGAHLAIVPAADEHWHIDRLHGLVVARVGDFGAGGQHQRQALEHQVHLPPPTAWVVVVLGRHLEYGVRLLDGSGLGPLQVVAGHFDQLRMAHFASLQDGEPIMADSLTLCATQGGGSPNLAWNSLSLRAKYRVHDEAELSCLSAKRRGFGRVVRPAPWRRPRRLHRKGGWLRPPRFASRRRWPCCC